MLLPRLQPTLRAALYSIGQPSQQVCLNDAFAALNIRAASPTLTFVRHASHAQQGGASKAKDGPGKRLGAKKSGEQYVIPGNIIFRQRGTHWFPGENCDMGRDHTIYATESGYVKYYKDPEKHPKRQYIGVVFERDQVLPLPRNSMRRRKLNMVAAKMEVPPAITEIETKSDLALQAIKQKPKKEKTVLQLRPGYMYREANWEIGRAAEKARVKAKEFKPRDRWAAWRKSWERQLLKREKRIIGGRKRK